MTTRNLYTSLIFADRPDLHITIGYYAKCDVEQGQKLTEAFLRFCDINPQGQYQLNLDKGAMFGPKKTVSVMIPTKFPYTDWCQKMRGMLPGPLDNRFPFRPHVTMPHEYTSLITVGAAVMHKQERLVWHYFDF